MDKKISELFYQCQQILERKPQSKEFCDLKQSAFVDYENLCKLLSDKPELLRLYEQSVENFTIAYNEETRLYFEEGYRLGLAHKLNR